MYPVGTSILYGRTGVCRVEEIGTPAFQKGSNRSYYTLRSVFSTSGERIYVPVDAAVSMRLLVNCDRALECLELLPRLKPKGFDSTKPAQLSAHYQEMLEPCEPEGCLLLLKEIELKEKELAAHKKKLGLVDSGYRKLAERLVCEEFAVALDATPDSIRKRVYARMRQGEPKQ